MIKKITINLTARLQPMHRHEIEDWLEEYCQQQRVSANVTGGGTLVADSGEPLEADIEIQSNKEQGFSDQDITVIETFFKEFLAPKGSSLLMYQEGDDVPKKRGIGIQEGLALHINGTELADEVYETCDVNVVVERCNELIQDLGQFHSYWEYDNTVLYFYGLNFEAMHERIKPFLAEYPLCQKCMVMQIA